ncbi:regulator of protease activity HflC (stomatin/prohibitin superfamily) [Weissella uvarum]|uniref:SPFH domain-containing protein n=1 Tax=Weissella uvarum TaxID=1479233 RepID=UPI0019607C77|nr:SPFH domain-containing protein [Weissella uvarum]MBM7617428.1 regulator of protease activity HflC (stomatin/prohibitin superfamily) [Weissella uvarum]MCM0595687.1 SPFH/Band 7/PHB domain protein [Weissella uvarum]
MFIIITLIILLLIVGIFSFTIIPPNSEGQLVRFGKPLDKTLESGFHFKAPWDRALKVSLAQRTTHLNDLAPITKDNAMLQVDASLTYHVSDARKFLYANDDPLETMDSIVNAYLRGEIGRRDMAECTSDVTEINKALLQYLQDGGANGHSITAQFGIKVDFANIDRINPNEKIQESMDKKIAADNETSAAIITAEGQKKVKLTNANAEKEMQAIVNEKELAQAINAAKMTETEATANANAIRIENEAFADVNPKYLQNRQIDSYNHLADGENNTVIVPSDALGSDIATYTALQASDAK